MMKYFFIFTAFCLSVATTAQNKIDVLHYTFSIELSDSSDQIKGNADITVKVLKNADYFQLDFVNSPKGMTKVYAFENQQPILIERVEGSDKIDIHPKKSLKEGETRTFTIAYSGIPADGLIISRNKYGHRTFFADNWPDRAHNWIPCVDDPSDKASVEFIITAPSHYQVVSNGLLIEETNLPGNEKLTHWKEDIPLPTKVMVIGAADFAVNYVGDINCVPVYSWVFPENKKEGFYDYALAKDILAFYMNYIGPYPYKKLANVQSKTIFGGMENAGAIFYAENSVTGDRQEEDLLAHEIVHQWFGDMATEKNFAHLWLSEGFATYLTHIYNEAKQGTESFIASMKAERDEVIDFTKKFHKPVVDSVSPYSQLLNINSYQKGSWILHMLRRELGDSVFRKSIRKYYETYAGKNAETSDLQKIFETVSGQDLSRFFQQWLYTPENPSLDIKWNYDNKQKTITINIVQKQQSEFRFHLDIQYFCKSGKKTSRELVVDRKIKSFIIPVDEKPVSVIADPNTSLLFEGTVTEQK